MFVLIGMVVLGLLLKILSVPIKIALKLFINAIAGGLILILVNTILSAYHYPLLPLAPLTSILVGIFGIPAVIIMVIIYVI